MIGPDPSHGSHRPATGSAARTGPDDESRGERVEVDEQFSAFYRDTIRQLVAFLVNQGAPFHVAADVAQDTMVKAYRRWNDLDRPRAWAYRVASRALVRWVASVEEDPVGQVPEPNALLVRPDAIAEWEGRYDLLPVLRSLPFRQRQVLAWTLAGYKPGDIAAEIGLPSETVRANLAKARRAAAARLKEREGPQ
ncbi:sigma-70 family RNA polymerase sigma factor [Streptomyces sp. NPDC059991]|uniref:sigma-70 family RNA polymerase sigma factor n=1 Tax=Streptomyces sp. NPDC059991 TaxID=3347028 RepID=UPI0036BB8005